VLKPNPGREIVQLSVPKERGVNRATGGEGGKKLRLRLEKVGAHYHVRERRGGP